jgi:hypothetical protein
MAEAQKPRPEIKRVGKRRVQTSPVKGQGAEPDPEPNDPKPSRHTDNDHDQRLKAEKPPHY